MDHTCTLVKHDDQWGAYFTARCDTCDYESDAEDRANTAHYDGINHRDLMNYGMNPETGETYTTQGAHAA